MLKNYLKIALRNFWRHKGYTLINCLGLAIGISCCLIALLYIGHEVSYDRFHEHSDRIYRLYSMQRRADGVRYSAGMSMPIGPAVAAEIPGCERVARLISGNGTLQYRDRTLTESIRFTDPDFFRIFSFPLREGDASTALQEMNSVVLSEETARKYFGDADAIGKRLSIRLHEDFEDFIVTGVAAPVPKTSSIDFKVLLRFEKNPRYESSKDNWTDFNHSVYVRLAQGVDPVEVERLLMPFSEMHLANFINYLGRFVDVAPETGEVFRLSLQPISEMHFDTRIHQGRSRSPVYIFVLAIIALMVLGSACINFINLSVARAMTRMKEVGIRKVAGANRKQLLVQFWIETMLLSFLALAIGMVFCEQALPYFNRFTRLQLTMDFFASPYMLAALLGLLLLTVLIAGTYPVLYISRYRPVEIFSGQMRLGRTSYFRQGLVVFQFGLSILFIISALVMSDQLVFLRSQNPGFNEEQVVVIPVMGQKDGAKLLQLFKIKLSTESGVASVTGASNNLGIGPEGSTFRSVSSFEYKGRQVNAHLLRIDPAYLRTLTISVVEGRAFREAVPGDRISILVNDTLAAKLSETASVVGLPLTGYQLGEITPTIIGVVKDFNFESLRSPIEPLLMHIDPATPIRRIFVRIRPENIPATIQALERHWLAIAPDAPFQYAFLDENVDRQYRAEQLQIQISVVATSLAILIACLGLFGLSVLAANRRTKEIGIRKVLGASVTGILVLMSKDFTRLVAIAFVVASPLAYFAMNFWLQNFAYRTGIAWWVFVLAGGLALAIALLTVSTQAIRAALANPVESLRYE